jgi:hypothetical protein
VIRTAAAREGPAWWAWQRRGCREGLANLKRRGGGASLPLFPGKGSKETCHVIKGSTKLGWLG